VLDPCQDHKQVGEGDTGPNTGGMGAYSPAPVVTENLWPEIRTHVFEKTVAALRRRGITYRGILYAGLMISKKGIRVLEFNSRFGDPECQAMLMRWEGDILPALMACAEGRLDPSLVKWKNHASVCVVMAAANYPGTPETGDEIRGLNHVRDAVVFHAGTKEQAGHLVTAGGRVLGVTAEGPDLGTALKKAYAAVDQIQFRGRQFRRDIGWRAAGKNANV